MKYLATLCALSAVACGAGAPAPTKPALAPSPASPNAAAPRSTAAVAPAAPASPFKVIGDLGGDNQIFPAGERGFILSQAGVELELAGDDIVQDPLLKRGVPVESAMISVEAIAGRWPDALWLSTTEPSGRSGYSTVWSWDGKSWSRKQRTQEGHFISGVQAWKDGRMLALNQAGMYFEASFLLLSGDAHVTLPEFSKTKQQEQWSMCMTNLKVDAWRAFPGGEVVALGERCDIPEVESQLAVERWATGAKQSTLISLPIAGSEGRPAEGYWSDTALGALSPNDIFVSAVNEKRTPEQSGGQLIKTDYFAHFDGKAWQQLPTPIPEGVNRMWVESDGVLFAANRNEELWARSAKGEWARVPWPAQVVAEGKLKLESFWPRGPGDVWAVVDVAATDHASRYLLHTRPASHPLPTPEAIAKKERQYHLPGPPVDWCQAPFVLLYTLGRKSPADYDYPATREALKGHSEFAEMKFVEFERDGRKFFGARAPDFKLGKKLAQLVKDKVPGSTPQLVCHDPEETRQLDIDLKTGKLRH